MLRYALIYGCISGAIVIATILIGIALAGGGGHSGGAFVGYLIMIVALALIFVAVKRFRDRERGGVIKFAPAFGLGIAVAVVAGLIYVAVWESYLAATDYAFIGDYTAGIIEKNREAGVTGAAMDKLVADMDEMVRQYGQPLFRLPMTFLEIFPVGLVIALISAAILKNPRAFPAREPPR